MSRIIVAGGFGMFGSRVVDMLRSRGHTPLIASRRPRADLQVNIESSRDAEASFRPGDTVIDTVGPFQERTTVLAEAAVEVGFDLIDLADDPLYVQSVQELGEDAKRAGIHICTACSTVSAVTAALLGLSDVERPRALTAVLAPSLGELSGTGTLRSLFFMLGVPVPVLRNGDLVKRYGWRETWPFRLPGEDRRRTGHLVASPDPVVLPRYWSTLREVSLYVDTRSRVVDALATVGSLDSFFLDRFDDRLARFGAGLGRFLGSSESYVLVRIEGREGRVVSFLLRPSPPGHQLAVLPSVLAAESFARTDSTSPGMISFHDLLSPGRFMTVLNEYGIRTQCWTTAVSERTATTS